MGVEVVWDNAERTIIRSIFSGKWTWDDFYQSLDQTYGLMDSVKHSVHLIVDMRTSRLMPSGSFMPHLQNIRRKMHPNMGATVMVGGGKFMEILSAIMDKLPRKREKKMQMVASLEEAYRYLATINSADT
jgi:hypothetical protein